MTGSTASRGSSAGDVGWPLRRAARLFGASEAVVDGARAVTYAELERRVGSLVAGIVELGVAENGRVGFLGVNSLAHVECSMGVPLAGRALVALNFRLSEPELAFIVEDCRIELLVVSPEELERGRRLRERCPSLHTLVHDGHGSCPSDCLAYEAVLDREPMELPPPAPETLAAISYTGGTTGRPKGVMLSHANLLANARHNLITVGHRREDRWLHVCPMFHVAGTANVPACTWVGAKQIILPRFEARAVAQTLHDEEVTHAVLVPTMLAMLLEELDRLPGLKFPSLRHIQYAASPISPSLQRRVMERFDCEVAQFYGMTEAAPTVTTLPAEDHRLGFQGKEPHASRLASIGVPVIGVEAEVRDPDGSHLPPGEIGELWVRGPNVMLGYWERPEATKAALAGGWYHTGDAARADGDGYLYIVDRVKDMIISGGENVYSIEVEAALMEHHAVHEAAVFGIPDARWGEAVHGVVVISPDPAVTSKDLIEHCRQAIAGYKVPRSIELRTEPLPKSGAGKVLKKDLREPFWADLGRHVN